MLYIVGTPIGNLDDMTFRAVDTLRKVDLIAAEDTRHTLRLLNHFDIKTHMTSYHEHNKKEKGIELLNKLQQGKDVAIVTDAGMPAISDPGEDLVRLCIENNIAVTTVPGATAFVTALVLSGLPTGNFSFEGFLSAKKTERIKKLESLKKDRRTLIFYEAPHKLLRTLDDIKEVFGNRNIAVCRELTKKFEQIVRDEIDNVINYFSKNNPKGEFVIVVDGVKAEKEIYIIDVYQHVLQMIDNGMDKKEAIAYVAKERGIPKRDVYNEVIRQTQ